MSKFNFPLQNQTPPQRWWEAPHVYLSDCTGEFETVQAVREYMGGSFVVGTIAVVAIEDREERESVVKQIIANPDILDTMDNPNVLDVRWFTRVVAPSQAIPVVASLPDPADCVDSLRPLIFDALPFLHPARILFHRVAEAYGTELYFNEFRAKEGIAELTPLIIKALNAFCALPESERARILNGWNLPCGFVTGTWSPAQWKEQDERNGEPYPMVMVWPGDGIHHKTSVEYHAIRKGNNRKVGIVIEPGARKTETVQALRDAATTLERQWEECIGNPTMFNIEHAKPLPCYGCGEIDAELVEVDGKPLCPSCIAERASTAGGK